MIRKPSRVQFDHKSLDDAAAVSKTINRIQDAVLNTVDQLVQRANNPTVVAARYLQSVAALQNLPNVTDVILNFDRRDYDTAESVTIASASRPWGFAVPEPGYYLVTAQAAVPPPAATVVVLTLKVYVNGMAIQAGGPQVVLDGNASMSPTKLNLSHVVYCVAGDEIAVAARMGGGASATVGDSGPASSIEITKIG